jgi:hypothetical protein
MLKEMNRVQEAIVVKSSHRLHSWGGIMSGGEAKRGEKKGVYRKRGNFAKRNLYFPILYKLLNVTHDLSSDPAWVLVRQYRCRQTAYHQKK